VVDKLISIIGGGDLRLWADRNAGVSDEKTLHEFEKLTAGSIKRSI
jgi:hypothetical protein